MVILKRASQLEADAFLLLRTVELSHGFFIFIKSTGVLKIGLCERPVGPRLINQLQELHFKTKITHFCCKSVKKNLYT